MREKDKWGNWLWVESAHAVPWRNARSFRWFAHRECGQWFTNWEKLMNHRCKGNPAFGNVSARRIRKLMEVRQ